MLLQVCTRGYFSNEHIDSHHKKERQVLNWISIGSGKHFWLEAQIRVDGKKRSGGNKITGIQVSTMKFFNTDTQQLYFIY